MRNATAAETEKDRRIRQLERTLERKSLEIEILENVDVGHQPSSLYDRKRPRGSRADRTYDKRIVMACGEKLAYGYRRVAWWLQRKKGLPVNPKRVLRVMR